MNGSLQPTPSNTTAGSAVTASWRMRRPNGERMALFVMSVARGESEIKGAARREWGEIDEATYRLIAEVARFRIHTRVLRPRHKIASAELDSRSTRCAENIARKRGGELVRKGELTQLHERPIEDVLRHAVVVVSRRPQSASVRQIRRESERVIDVHGDVDEISAMRPVKQRSEPELAEGEVVSKPHREHGRGIALLNFLDRRAHGVGGDDLRHALSDLQPSNPVPASERDSLSARIALEIDERKSRGKCRHNADVSGESRVRFPIEAVGLHRSESKRHLDSSIADAAAVLHAHVRPDRRSGHDVEDQ